MKVHDSGMPEASYWNSLFDLPRILDWLPLSGPSRVVAELGCGYGTFTLPIAQVLTGTLHACDIEPGMIDVVAAHVERLGLGNVQLSCRNLLEAGTGLEKGSVDLVLLFNILHSEESCLYLAEADRILKPGGVAAVLHWRKDMETPRGPAMASRPDSDRIAQATLGLALRPHGEPRVLEPYHWGLLLSKATGGRGRDS